jgi:hypothetical protein
MAVVGGCGEKKWFTMSLEAAGGHTSTSTFVGPPAPPQACRGAKKDDTISSTACLGRKRPAGDSISAAGGVLGRREACGAWWWAWGYGAFPPPEGVFRGFFPFFFFL